MTVAETLREWASGADEDMRGPLEQLAAQYEAELTAARQETERNALAPVAEVLGCEAEVFAMIGEAKRLAELEAKTNAEKHARQEKVAAAKATVAASKSKRAQAAKELCAALENAKMALIAIEHTDLTDEQIAERASGRN